MLINYYSDEFENDSHQKLNNEIAAGNEPDLLYINDYIPFLNYANKNMFVDLDTYLDKSPELKADLLPFITENTRIKGQLPQLVTSFTTQTLMTKSKNMDHNLSIEKLMEIYKTLPSDVSLFNGSYRSFIYGYFLDNLIPECVDYEKGMCDFNIPEMKCFLELLKLVADSSAETYSIDENLGRVRADELYFLGAVIYGYDYFILYNNKPFMPDESAIVGYPTVDESKRGDWIISKGFSIFNTSNKKDGAWEFIKYCLSDELYRNGFFSRAILPTKSGVKFKVNEASDLGEKEYTYLNEKGFYGYVTTNDEDTAILAEKHGTGMLYKTADLVNAYMSYLETLDNYVYYDSNVRSIIYDETSTYMNSDKSIDDTIKAIQSRVSIYMSETWG